MEWWMWALVGLWFGSGIVVAVAATVQAWWEGQNIIIEDMYWCALTMLFLPILLATYLVTTAIERFREWSRIRTDGKSISQMVLLNGRTSARVEKCLKDELDRT